MPKAQSILSWWDIGSAYALLDAACISWKRHMICLQLEKAKQEFDRFHLQTQEELNDQPVKPSLSFVGFFCSNFGGFVRLKLK